LNYTLIYIIILTLKGHTSANLHRQNFQIAGVSQVDAAESSLHHDNPSIPQSSCYAVGLSRLLLAELERCKSSLGANSHLCDVSMGKSVADFLILKSLFFI